ncbi:MAG: nitrous oxide reductase family maturation protein NosD [Rhodocyclaceae bacterium]|nr:nitrous oxide reductase family maturation protein NosD [Rhodocyclaceae bacterium]
MWRLPSLFLVLFCAPFAAGQTPLQPLLDQASPGAVIRLPAGDYAGPAVIAKPLTLDGQGRARLFGNGRSTVLTVATHGATVRGLYIANSGESHDRVDAGILLLGNQNLIENNVLEDVLFALHIQGGHHNTIRANAIVGKNLPLALRGDALRIWHGQGNRIEGNDFRRARDITLANAPDNRLVGNSLREGRYGMHLIFSPRVTIEKNRIAHVATGIVALYSSELVIRANTIREAWAGGGAALVFKESGGALVAENEILHCATGLLADAPLNTELSLRIVGNRFAHNAIGLAFYGEAGGHTIRDNRFENNLTQVFLSAPKVGAANVWDHNFWSDYQGFDRNGDGVGDTPHELWSFADRIWQELPAAKFFANSPLFELIDFLERLAPFSAPHRILRDERPRMR